MVEIIQVKDKKQQREFVEYPLRLYKNHPCFVPPLYDDETSMFTKKNIYYNTCDSVFYLAQRDGQTVGRIQGIVQKQYNEIHGTKQARFTRFDCEDDAQTAKLLFDAVETWAREQGMEEVIGPMGYSDLEREGLLIAGFDYLATFEEQYNYEYYPALVEACGYEKDVDWLEHRLFSTPVETEKMKKVGDHALKKYNLHVGGEKLSTRAYINKYKQGIFECIDECYKELYGTVPFTPEMQKQMVDQFNLMLNKKYLRVICDENEKVVAFGLCLPGIGEALQKSGGRLTIPALFRLLGAINKPKSIDLALVGILPKYRKTGIIAFFITTIQEMLEMPGVEYLETNLNLETNKDIQLMWSRFNHIQHKRRRSYIKKLS